MESTMTVFNTMLRCLLLSALLSACIAGAQNMQTIFVTQTIFTACECSQTPSVQSPAGLPSPLTLSTATPNPETLSVLQASATAATAATSVPAVIPGPGQTTGLSPVSATPNPETMSVLQASATAGSSSPAVVPAPGQMSEASSPEPAPVTISGTFPSLSVLSSALPVSLSAPMTSLLSSFTLESLTVTPASIASAVSLSNGLGPLLSSPEAAPSLFSSGTTAASILPRPSTMTGSAQTATPSAASSTSGHGSTASTSASAPTAISSVSMLSSLDLSSFPSGASLATDVQGLTTYSTVTLSSISLTGVTVLAPRSPTSCFTLPTPAASMDLVAVAVSPMDDLDLSHPLLMAFGENATTPQYVGALANGEPYVLNLSPDNPITGQLGLEIPGQNALVFDGSGMSLFTGNCSSISQIIVDNFWDQLSAMAPAAAPATTSSQLDRRSDLNTTNFTVQVSMDSYLKTPFFSPNLTFGNSLCDLQVNTFGSATDNITWSCMYPPPEGGAKACEARLATWLNGMSSPSSSPQNSTEVLATISPFLTGAGSSLLGLFPVSDPALGLGLTFMQKINLAAKQAVSDVGATACDVLHIFDSDDLVIHDDGPLGLKTLGSFIHMPPASMALNLAASATASITALPPRILNPTDNLLSQIATIFPSILGPFLSWISALPTPSFPLLSGIFGLEETGAMTGAPMLTEHLATITSTGTSPTPTAAHMKQAPTVTVTHVLGDGWFTPSTYTVSPGTSTISESPTTAANAPAAIISAHGASAGYPSNVIDDIVGRLATMMGAGAGVRPDRHWDWPNGPTVQDGTTSSSNTMGYDGHVVLVTTTVTVFNDSPQAGGNV